MRKLLLFILAFLPFLVFAQKDYDSHYMSIPGAGDDEYEILISEKKGGLDDVYIYAHSLDNIYSKSVLIVNGKKIPVFKQYLIYVRDKFNEWKGKAESNNVESFSKQIDAELKDSYKAAFGTSDWNFDNRVQLKSFFSVNDGISSLYITSGNLYSSSNRFIESKGLVFYYTDGKQLDDLINKMDIQKITDAISNVKDTDILFK